VRTSLFSASWYRVADLKPRLRAHAQSGERGVLETAERLVESVRSMLLLLGARRVSDVPRLPRVLGPALREWIDAAERFGATRDR